MGHGPCISISISIYLIYIYNYIYKYTIYYIIKHTIKLAKGILTCVIQLKLFKGEIYTPQNGHTNETLNQPFFPLFLGEQTPTGNPLTFPASGDMWTVPESSLNGRYVSLSDLSCVTCQVYHCSSALSLGHFKAYHHIAVAAQKEQHACVRV